MLTRFHSPLPLPFPFPLDDDDLSFSFPPAPPSSSPSTPPSPPPPSLFATEREITSQQTCREASDGESRFSLQGLRVSIRSAFLQGFQLEAPTDRGNKQFRGKPKLEPGYNTSAGTTVHVQTMIPVRPPTRQRAGAAPTFFSTIWYFGTSFLLPLHCVEHESASNFK